MHMTIEKDTGNEEYSEHNTVAQSVPPQKSTSPPSHSSFPLIS